MASTTVDDEFLSLADPLRSELLAHCYRMLGSPVEANGQPAFAMYLRDRSAAGTTRSGCTC